MPRQVMWLMPGNKCWILAAGIMLRVKYQCTEMGWELGKLCERIHDRCTVSTVSYK